MWFILSFEHKNFLAAKIAALSQPPVQASPAPVETASVNGQNSVEEVTMDTTEKEVKEEVGLSFSIPSKFIKQKFIIIQLKACHSVVILNIWQTYIYMYHLS